MTSVLENLTRLMAQSSWLAPLLALAGGVLTSLTPCALSGIALVIAYVGGAGERDVGRAFRLSVVFVAGSAVTFAALGLIASLAGKFMGNSGSWWFVSLGTLMVLMALQIWGIFELIPSSYLVSRSTKRGLAGAFIAGILGGIFSSPCSTPVLIALLAVAAGRGSMLWGGLLLLVYSLGHGIPAVIAGTSMSFVQKLSAGPKYGRYAAVSKAATGVLVLAVGFYMFWLGF